MTVIPPESILDDIKLKGWFYQHPEFDSTATNQELVALAVAGEIEPMHYPWNDNSENPEMFMVVRHWVVAGNPRRARFHKVSSTDKSTHYQLRINKE